MTEVIDVDLRTAEMLCGLNNREQRWQVPIALVRQGLVVPANGVTRNKIAGEDWVAIHFMITAKGIKVLEALLRQVFPGVHELAPGPDPVHIKVPDADLERIRETVSHMPVPQDDAVQSAVPNVKG